MEPLFQEGIALMRRVHTAPFHRLAQGLLGYARFLIEKERHDEAEAMVEEAQTIDRSVFGNDHVRTATSLEVLGLLHSARRNYEAAEAALRRAFEILERNAKEASYET